jgi:serine phosphatase RsbU (regulator of sigma subunit)
MRPDEQQALRIVALGLLLGATFGVQALVPDLGPIYVGPILVAAYWFGRSAALVAAVIASALLGADAVLSPDLPPTVLIASIPAFLALAHLGGRFVEEQREQRRELSRLRAIQDALVPATPPELPLLEVATRYVPAEHGVAGDFYLVADGPNNSTVFVVGDVAGKGLHAARRASFVRATITAAAPYSDDPVALLRLANAELFRQHGASAEFITMLCLVVSPDGRVKWSRAGHPPPVRLSDGAPIGDCAAGLPLGIAPYLPAAGAEGRLPREGVLLYTDGLTDARPPGGRYETYGTARLARALAELGEPTPAEAVDQLVQAARVFARGALPDDLCLLALRSRLPHTSWLEDEGARLEAEAPAEAPGQPTQPA